MITSNKFYAILKNPRTIPRVIINQFILYFKVYFVRDKSSLALLKWFGDCGDEILRFDYPLNPESIVIDLGGYKGEFAFEINNRFDSYVYVFEPVKKFYNICESLFKNNSKVKVFNYGLSSQYEEVFISDEDNSSSIINNNNINTNCELVILKNFEKELDILRIDSIDLLKINIEGPEFIILPYLINSQLIKKVKYLQVQFHSFYPNAESLRDRIRKELSITHREMWNYPFVWESWVIR